MKDSNKLCDWIVESKNILSLSLDNLKIVNWFAGLIVLMVYIVWISRKIKTEIFIANKK